MDRLLVIDDEIELGRFVGRVGESIGYEVEVTSRVQEFKDLIDQWKPSVILLDLSMPEADGLELLRWMASENCRTQIIIMSGFDARVVDAAKRIGLERGLNIHYALNKPIRAQDLKEKLETLKRTNLESVGAEEIRQCVADRKMFLLYQPKVSLRTGALRGVEALVRWHHPQHGVMPSEQFVAMAEDAGVMEDLTDFILGEAFRQQKEWTENGLFIQMAVNLSPSNLRNDRLVERLAALCNTEGVAPEQVILEVTESLAMGHALEALDTLTRLRLKGFCLAIDDFGTGFSSLTRLQRLPVTEIKIDRSFVTEALKMSDAFIIVKTIIDLARNMRMTSVAEGVETPKHYQLLAELGCDMGQGNGIAKPLSAGEFRQWAAQWQAPRQGVGGERNIYF